MICVLMSISLWAQVAVLDILHIFTHVEIILQLLDCLGQVICRLCIWVELPVQRRLYPIF